MAEPKPTDAELLQLTGEGLDVEAVGLFVEGVQVFAAAFVVVMHQAPSAFHPGGTGAAASLRVHVLLQAFPDWVLRQGQAARFNINCSMPRLSRDTPLPSTW